MLESKRCTALCKDGVRCRRHVIIGQDLCHTHLRYQRHLLIKTSTIPGAGRGLFACDLKAVDGIVFRPGDKLGKYIGERLTLAQLHERYGVDATPPYALEISKSGADGNGIYLDPALDRGFLSIANAKTVATQCNARFMNPNNQHEVSIVATKNIRHGDEVFLHYGPHTKDILAADSSTVFVRK